MGSAFAYINGIGGLFYPGEQITRAQVATIIARLMVGGMDIPTGYTTSFVDVPEGAWYYDAVAYIEFFGIVEGDGKGHFEPERFITRAEFTAMLMRFFKLERYDGEPIFSDLDESHWAYDYLNMAHAYGFVEGYTDGTCCPDQNIRRGEAVTLINRILGRELTPEYVAEHLDELTTFPDVSPAHWAYYHILAAANSFTLPDDALDPIVPPAGSTEGETSEESAE